VRWAAGWTARRGCHLCRHILSKFLPGPCCFGPATSQNHIPVYST
jgi:hypothetical protein